MEYFGLFNAPEVASFQSETADVLTLKTLLLFNGIQIME